jgi:hypothetical protein
LIIGVCKLATDRLIVDHFDDPGLFDFGASFIIQGEFQLYLVTLLEVMPGECGEPDAASGNIPYYYPALFSTGGVLEIIAVKPGLFPVSLSDLEYNVKGRPTFTPRFQRTPGVI